MCTCGVGATKLGRKIKKCELHHKNTFLKNVHSIITMSKEDGKNLDPSIIQSKAKYINFLPNSVQRKMKKRQLI